MTDEQFALLLEASLMQVATLREIRDLLTAGVQAAEDEDDSCSHPEDARVDLRSLSHPDHWICNLCKYEHLGLTRN